MRRSKITKSASLLLLAAITIALPHILNNDYWMSVVVFMGINILLVCGIRHMWLVGNISLGQVGFSLVGAYCSGLLAIHFHISFIEFIFYILPFLYIKSKINRHLFPLITIIRNIEGISSDESRICIKHDFCRVQSTKASVIISPPMFASDLKIVY